MELEIKDFDAKKHHMHILNKKPTVVANGHNELEGTILNSKHISTSSGWPGGCRKVQRRQRCLCLFCMSHPGAIFPRDSWLLYILVLLVGCCLCLVD
jgi:hypothetical protein